MVQGSCFSKLAIAIMILVLACIPQAECEEVKPRNSTIEPYSPKKYKIDLDLPPKARWAELIRDYKAPIKAFRDYMRNLIGFASKFLEYLPLPLSLASSYDPTLAEEIHALAELSDLTFNEVYALNFAYEFNAVKACTSIILRTESGRIIHGRNLDYDYQPYLANISADVVFYRNGTALYEANVLAGAAGVSSGIKYGKFGITLNERDISSIWDNLGEYLFKESAPSTYLVRKVFENANNFDEAVQILSKTRIIAPSYFIVSGTQPHEGVVITRGSNDVKDMTWLFDCNPNWFLVHTNYDRDLPDPAEDYRRIPAEGKLNATQQKNISEQTLMDVVLSQYPNLNDETILTAIFSVETGYYNTTMWY